MARDSPRSAPIAEQWRALAARALEPNVFYDPAFALAAAPVFGATLRRGAGVVDGRHADGPVPGAHRGLARRRVAGIAGWTHPYAPLGTPLVDRDEAEPVIAAWLDHLARDPAMPALLMLPMLPESGAFARALDAVLARKRPAQRGLRPAPARPARARHAARRTISSAPCRRAGARNCAASAAGWRSSRR